MMNAECRIRAAPPAGCADSPFIIPHSSFCIRPEICIRPAAPADVPFLVAAARGETDTIGFLPRQAVIDYIDRGGVLIARLDGQRAGFILFRLSRPRPQHSGLSTQHSALKIIQTAVAPAARRRGVGRALVDQVAALASRPHSSFIIPTSDFQAQRLSCWCADDLPANRFWRAAGFEPAGSREGGRRRRRTHTLYVRILSTPD